MFKKFTYYKKGEKLAILFLFVLIVLSSILYHLSGIWHYEKKNNEEEILAQSEFENFQKQLAPVFYSAIENDKDTTEVESYSLQHKGTSSSAKQTKLTEGQTIDINAANANSLKRVPGIGDAFANRIIEYRDQLGGFIHPQQLMEIKGFSKNKYEKTSAFFVLKKKHKKIKINSIPEEKLSTHPYISETQSRAIIEKRKLAKLQAKEDLLSITGFTKQSVENLANYLTFD